jgi:hypothetical protein
MGSSGHGPEQPPSAAEAYDENGVDRTMIRSALRRTPTECLEALDELLELAETARHVPEPLR